MALTASQIVELACQIAKAKGMRSQAGQFLNSYLRSLAQFQDFDLARGDYSFNFNPSLITTSAYPNNQPGSGPYPLPADFLRIYGEQWFLLGVPYPMIPCDLKEFDLMVQTAGLQSYPYIFATDMSKTPPNLLVWPPSSGSFPVLIRYYKQPADIATPEDSNEIPWFPNSDILIQHVAGSMMKVTGDSRWSDFVGDPDPRKDSIGSACALLRAYLKLKDDSTDRSKRVHLDRRRFGMRFSQLPNTKIVGW